MKSTDFTMTLRFDQTPHEVFNAIQHVGGWWQGEITGHNHMVQDEFSYRMRDMHFSKQQVTELIPDQRIVWMVTDSDLSFTKTKNEWTGTHIVFDIASVDGKTELRFTHEGLVPEFECYGGCSQGWTMLLQESLFSLITTGKGVEVFG